MQNNQWEIIGDQLSWESFVEFKDNCNVLLSFTQENM